MSQFDDVYQDLCTKILENGVESHNRTGIDTVKIPAYHFELNTGKEFPILTTKQVFIRQAVLEMLWIYQEQSNDVRWLQERNVHIWDEWEVNENGDWISNTTGEVLKHLPKEYAHTIGTAYGYIVKKYHLIDRLINDLKNHPDDRRMVMSLWQDSELETAVLPSCVWSSEWDITDGKLNVWVHQRSCDVALGLPFNVTQYAVLQAMLAQVCNLEIGTMNWSIKNAHIYSNQLPGIMTQMARYKANGGGYKSPKLVLQDVDDFYKFDSSKECLCAKLEGYKHMGKLKFPLAQ